MSDVPTWNAILQRWPWFAAAAGVFVVAVALIVLNPNSKRRREATAIAPEKTGWILTERIDFTDDRAADGLVLQVEEKGALVKRSATLTS